MGWLDIGCMLLPKTPAQLDLEQSTEPEWCAHGGEGPRTCGWCASFNPAGCGSAGVCGRLWSPVMTAGKVAEEAVVYEGMEACEEWEEYR